MQKLTFGVRGDVEPSTSPSLDATLSVPVGDKAPEALDVEEDVESGVEGAGTGDAGATKGDLGTGVILAGSVMGFILMPYFCSESFNTLSRTTLECHLQTHLFQP